MKEMRTVPPPHAGAPAGYALGISRSRWRAGKYLDIFFHGGGGDGFLSAMYWVPPLHLGVAVLTNSSDAQDLEDIVALGLLHDLVTEPGSVSHHRFLALPAQVDVAEPDVHFSPPADLATSIKALALPPSRQQSERWAAYPEFYRSGRRGAMNPSYPASRFHVKSGVPYFDAGEDGTLVRHRLTEVRPGVFLAENGETLDLPHGIPVLARGAPATGHERSASPAVGAAGGRRRGGRRLAARGGRRLATSASWARTDLPRPRVE